MKTVPCEMTEQAPAPTLDDVVAAAISESERAALAAYAALCGGSLVTWLAKGWE